jgi:hypothetical protein
MVIALFTWRQEVKYAPLPATGLRSRFSRDDFFMSTISSPAQEIDPLDSAVSYLIGWCDSLAPKNASVSNSIPVCSASTPIAFIL